MKTYLIETKENRIHRYLVKGNNPEEARVNFCDWKNVEEIKTRDIPTGREVIVDVKVNRG